MDRLMSPQAATLWPGITLPIMNAFLIPADKGFPLRAGFELYIDAPDAELDPKLQFTFDVAFSEPGVIEGRPVLETLHQMANLVEGSVSSLTPRLG